MINEIKISTLLNNTRIPVIPPDADKLPTAEELKSVVLPPVPPYPKPDEQVITKGGAFDASDKLAIAKAADFTGTVKEDVQGDKILFTIFGTPQVMPLKIKLKSESSNDFWLLPVEPMISIDGKNIIAKRNVAKKRDGGGSVKEYWTQDDWTINISGLLTNPNTTEYPWSDFNKLKKYCEAKEPLEVLNPEFDKLGVTHIVIESFSLPFTKGPENQTYTISAVSDKSWDLFIPLSATIN
jgi:hypothetical protein